MGRSTVEAQIAGRPLLSPRMSSQIAAGMPRKSRNGATSIVGRVFVRNRAELPNAEQAVGVLQIARQRIVPLICPTCQNVFAG
jgi:hypothetical protein